MVKKAFEVEAELRNEIGRGASRRLRREEKVPGIMYGGGKETVALMFEHNKMSKALENEAFYSHILTLKTGSEVERVILKDLQRHPFKPKILHIDFQRVRSDEKLHMHVPMHFTNAEIAPGVKEAGGVVSHIMSDVEVACFPDDLPEYIEVDLSNMAMNEILHLSDLTLPKGVEIVALVQGNDKPVVSIHMPRAQEEEVIPVEAPTAAEVPAIAQKSEDKGPTTEGEK